MVNRLNAGNKARDCFVVPGHAGKEYSYIPDSIQVPGQILAGLVAIGLGVFIYIAFRPAWQTGWLPYIASFDLRRLGLWVEIGYNLPSFFHVFGFSLLTAGIMIPRRRTYLIVCSFWLILDLLFELLQTDAAYAWVNYSYLNHDSMHAVWHWLTKYSSQGIFDPKDIFALITGASLAYIILILTKKERRLKNENEKIS